MKKITLALLAFASVSTIAKAQITVTSSNMPTAGDKFIWVYDSSGTVTSPGSAGASQTWNFSSMNAKAPDTITVMNSSSTPYASKFPAAGLALKLSQGNSEYEYVNTTSSDFQFVGVTLYNSTYGQIYYHMNPIWNFYALPATYQTKWGGVYRSIMKTPYTAYPGYDSIGIIEHGIYTDSIDSYGNITTPAGTYNSLRDKHLEKDIDSTIVHVTSGSWMTISASVSYNNFYSWYSNSVNYFIAEITMDSLDLNVTGVQWLKNAPSGINELVNSNGKTLVFPDPAHDVVNIQTPAGMIGSIKIVDMEGREIEKSPFTGRIQIETSHYSSGVYFYIITDSSGNIVGHDKFSVVR